MYHPAFTKIHFVSWNIMYEYNSVTNVSWYIVCHSGSPQLVYSDGWVMRIAQKRGEYASQERNNQTKELSPNQRNFSLKTNELFCIAFDDKQLVYSDRWFFCTVNKQIKSLYQEACEKRSGWFFDPWVMHTEGRGSTLLLIFLHKLNLEVFSSLSLNFLSSKKWNFHHAMSSNECN